MKLILALAVALAPGARVHAAEAPLDGAGFKVVTLNVRTADADAVDRLKGNDWAARKERLLSALEGMGAQLVGLQELSAVQSKDLRTRFRSTHRLLTGSGGLGLLVDEKVFSVRESGSGKLEGSDEWGDRYFLWALLDPAKGCGCVLAVDTHFSTEQASRLANSRTLAGWLKKHQRDCALLVMGDLNEQEGPVTARIRALAGRGQEWSAAAPGIGTFNDFASPPGGGLASSLRLDHILVRSPGLRLTGSKIHDSHPEGNAYSDHYALEASLTLDASACRP